MYYYDRLQTVAADVRVNNKAKQKRGATASALRGEAEAGIPGAVVGKLLRTAVVTGRV